MHAAAHASLSLVLAGFAASFAGVSRGPFVGFGAGFGPLKEHRLTGSPLAWAALGLAATTIKCVAAVYATYVQRRLSGEVGAALRLELLDALLTRHRVRRPRHADHGGQGAESVAAAASQVAALTDRVHEVEIGLQHGALGGALAVAQLIPLVVLLIALSARTALIAGATLGAFGFVLARVRAGYRRAALQAARERTDLLEAADESVRHAELWVSYGAEAKARARLSELGVAIVRTAAFLEARAAAMSGVNEVLAATALVAGVGFSRLAGLDAPTGGAGLLAFAIAFFMMYRPMRELTEARAALVRAAAAYEGLRSTVADRSAEGGCPTRPDTSDRAPSAARSWPLAPVELRGLRLAHGACGPLSVRFQPGAIVAVAGPTGVGKTTLLRTLLGFERPVGGEIEFDGAPLSDAPAGPSGRPFAWVPQDAPLLADTLDANLALGVGPAETQDALDPLGAGHLRSLLGQARLGAGGRVVSGGERQWIALARAIATRQPVLLLDEPTSGLDGLAQQRVLQAIAALRGFRTVILVTHRTEPLAIADSVVRLEAIPPSHRAA